MATTRTPLQPAPTLEAFDSVGCHVYLVRYREGQEDLARESIYRFARNPDLAFSDRDAAAMGDQIPYVAECDCGPGEVTFSVTPYYEPSPFWDWLAATLKVGAVFGPWALLMILGRVVWGWL